MILLRDTSKERPAGVVHVYCRHRSQCMVDVLGFRDEKDYLRRECYDFNPYAAEIVSENELKGFYGYTFGRGGLYMDEEFVEAASSRGFRLISGNRKRYDPHARESLD